MYRTTLIIFTLSTLLIGLNAAGRAPKRDFYQLKIYHLKNTDQEKTVETFLEKAYLPALHRAGIEKIGVFKPVPAAETPELLIYVFIPFSGYEQFSKLEQKLSKDRRYQQDGSAYLDATIAGPPFERMESILLNAFNGSPHFNMPKLSGPKKDRIYELRSYEGPTEKLYWNKVEMFNKGDEIGLFRRLNFNAVFYGEVVSGSRMPNLMYLTTFENRADRDEHWKAFSNDAYWKQLSAKPEYQGNVSRNDTRFLYPVGYSDI